MYRFAESQARVGTGEAAWPMGWSGEAWNADGTERGEGRGGGCELRSPIPLLGARFVIEAPPHFSAVCRVLLRPPSPLPSRARARPPRPARGRPSGPDGSQRSSPLRLPRASRATASTEQAEAQLVQDGSLREPAGRPRERYVTHTQIFCLNAARTLTRVLLTSTP